MAGYTVNHQTDFIKIPLSDARIDCIEYYTFPYNRVLFIKPKSIEALDRIIEQCRDIKLSMMEEQ